MATDYSRLLKPGRIGSMELKNRMIVTAMGVSLAEADGSCGERIRAYHTEQAKGGAGLIIMGVTGVGWPRGGNQINQIAISDDRFIPGLSLVAEAVHEHGGKLAAQLHHGGLVGVTDMLEGRPVWAPSLPVVKQGDFEQGFLEEEFTQTPFAQATDVQLHVMTREDIDEAVEMFAAAAGRAKRAGLDGVEIHAGHGYLISSFLSPQTNNRSDEYGGPLENRARLLMHVIRAVRERVGRDFPVWCKLDAGEYGAPEGISLTDAVKTARMAEDAGVDAITVSAYHDTSRGAMHSESNIPHVPERNVAGASRFKAALKIPVITSGRIEPEAADRYIGQGRFDFLSMGRKILADPHLPRKIAEGKPEEIRPCIYCYCCVSQIYLQRPVKCAVNPETAYERERGLAPASQSKHVAVVGGGPAGMEAARRLTIRGHKVTLLEQSDRLGGTVQFAAIAYRPNEGILNWLRRQIEASSVEVRLNTRATPELIKSLGADEVVVATGAVRTMPPIPGADQPNVYSGDDMRRLVLGDNLGALKEKTTLVTRLAARAGSVTGATKNLNVIRNATKRWMPLGERIVIIGGELVGLELAEFLAERDRQVTVIDEAPRLGAGLYLVRRLRLLDELRQLGVTMLAGATDITIGDHEVSYVNYRRQTRSIGADHIIVAKGATGDSTLADELRAAGFTVHTAGDCTGVRYIEGATESAAEVAMRI